MTAVGLRVLTLAFPDPDSNPIRSDDFQPVNASISYTFQQLHQIRTLSTNTASPGHNIDGLLFAPQLSETVCPEASQYVPANATSPDDLPDDNNIYWIAIAPWINPTCTLAYLTSVRNTQAQAFLFYLTDNGTDIPPVANDPTWSLGDGGHWKTSNRFPVYAIASMLGGQLMEELVDYSGNVTDVPNGNMLIEQWPATDYVRLAAEVTIEEGSSRLPSLWIFLLIVLGILILIIGTTSCSMHWIQRRRRNQLQQRVAAGEVDLEALGIKRLTVPQEMIDKMPLYTYTDDAAPTPAPAATAGAAKEMGATATETADLPASASVTNVVHPHLHGDHFAQSTCPICLEDYVAGETTVRELPCRHLFHPECVDSFLLRNSSLCPMCKKSVLPKGHCPAMVTNAMVRRERMVRLRRQGRLASAAEADAAEQNAARNGEGRYLPPPTMAFTRMRDMGRRVFSAPERRTTSQRQTAAAEQDRGSVELRTTAMPAAVTEPVEARPATADGQACPTPAPPADRQSRREWARQRAASMVGQRQRAQENEIEAIAASRPLWRRAVGRVFPGFA